MVRAILWGAKLLSKNHFGNISAMDQELKVSISIPFPSKRAAQIAYDVLRVDAEPKKNHVKKTLVLDEETLKA